MYSREDFYFMDKAIIVGAFEFIGFHLCMALLEEGIEVIGIHIPTEDDDICLEEKRLEIGRNSNFVEKDETYFVSLEPLRNNVIIFVDYYSYYMNRQEHKLKKILNTTQFLENASRFVLLLPIQLCEEKIDHNRFLTQKKDKERDNSMFFLPTIYGPWQPANYAFHQALLDPTISIRMDDREWTGDALYIEDAIETIMLHLGDRENNLFLLRSKIKDHWRKVALKLFIQPPIDRSNESMQISKDVTVLYVKGKEINDGIDRQKRHLARLK
jgi:hypothetical protein